MAIDWGYLKSIGVPQKPRRFIKNTIEKNINEYKEIIKEYLSK